MTYHSAAAHKLLTDNRDRYIAQSAATRDGRVPTISESDELRHRAQQEHEQEEYA